MLSTAHQSVGELSRIKIFLQVITKIKIIKIKKEFVKLLIAEQFSLDTIKKKFVKVVREKDILNASCRGVGLKSRLGAKIYDNREFGVIC